MKLYSIIIFMMLGISLSFSQNNSIQDSIKVRGNCEECKNRIENAVKKLGDIQASWGIESKTLTLEFNPNLYSKKQILKSVADAGYDNELYLSEDKDYNNLPDCCKYDRSIPFDLLGKINLSETHLVESEHNENEQNNHSHIKVKEESEPQLQENEVFEDERIYNLEGITLEGNKAATRLSAKEAGLTFNIDKTELVKAACCNLSESFETNATVDVSFANAVTGTKQIKLLGLDQKYSLITRELLPVAGGLSVANGFSYIPGRWISSIQLTKGSGSVTNGYESISGHINTELVKDEEDFTSLNFYANTNSRIEFNLVESNALRNNWNQSILLHGNATLERLDTNNDNFIDNPIGNQINAAYLLNYNGINKNGFGSHFGINWLMDDRTGGEMNFKSRNNTSSQDYYGYTAKANQFVLWNKTGYVFKNKPYRSFGFTNQFTYYDLNNMYGLRRYDGSQRSFDSKLLYEDIIGSTEHKYTVGFSYSLDNFEEDYNQQNSLSSFNRTEYNPGVFGEYTYTGSKVTAVIGSRVDFHNLAATQFSPRIHIKYEPIQHTNIRLSAGRGFRTANIFAENLQYFASNRLVVIEGNGDIYNLDAETAWNYGISLQQKFRIFGKSSTLVADFFRTNFDNQILPDLYQSNQQIVFYNSEDSSQTDAFQIQLDFEPMHRLEARLAYKWYKSERVYKNETLQVPFTPEHRGFLNLGYKTIKTSKFRQWTFDTTLQWIGKQVIPLDYATKGIQYSDDYLTLNAQVAWQLSKSVRLYSGVDNIAGEVQSNPIISADNPFSDTFDAGMIYAPIMPQNIYFGLDIDF